MISLRMFARAFGACILKMTLNNSCALGLRILSNSKYSYGFIYQVPVFSMPLSMLVHGKESWAKQRLNLTGDPGNRDYMVFTLGYTFIHVYKLTH